MKLRYYMRGLGIGILVTAIIMGVSGGQKLSDEEIKARALQLGMVEGTSAGVLSDLQANAEETKSSVVEESIPQMESVEETKEEKDAEVSGEATEEIKAVEETKESVEATEESKTAETSKESTEASKPVESTVTSESTGEKITIIVKGGDSSVSVSNDLAAAGLVEDAKEYDKYLCSNGYDKKICVGTYEIEVGSDYETIAKIITKR